MNTLLQYAIIFLLWFYLLLREEVYKIVKQGKITNKCGKISNNVIRRLPRYLRKLDELQSEGISRGSSKELGEQLGLTPSQIRQDFSCFGEFGQQGYGYNVVALREQIAAILGMDRGYEAVLIGVGNLGHALMDNFSFADCGIHLAAAFDIKESLIGTTFKGVPILSEKEMTDYLKTHDIAIAVLCVPKEVAVHVTNIVIDCGIEAIWNFTNIELTEPNSPTIVENVHFSDSLLFLNYYVSERMDEKAAHTV